VPLPKMTAVVLASALALAACSDGDDAEDAREETSSTSYEQPTVALEIRSADLVSTHAARAPLAPDVASEITEVIEQLLLITSAEPLTVGEAGAGFAELFTPDAGAQAGGEDRAAIFDEGLPSFGALEPANASIAITALNGAMSTEAAFAVVDLQWDVGGTRDPGDRIIRTGELSLVRGDGGWKIAAYDLHVKRTIADDTTTTTARSETTT
jgi:hypothetical protein